MAMHHISLDYLNVGSEVCIKTSLDKEITGQVVSCEGHSRLLLLKSHRAEQAEGCDDLHMINMDHVKAVRVIRETAENLEGARGTQRTTADLGYVDISLLDEFLKKQSLALSRERSHSARSSQQGSQTINTNATPGAKKNANK